MSNEDFINKKLLFSHQILKSLGEGGIEFRVSPSVNHRAFIFFANDKTICTSKVYRRKYLLVKACNCLDVFF